MFHVDLRIFFFKIKEQFLCTSCITNLIHEDCQNMVNNIQKCKVIIGKMKIIIIIIIISEPMY